MPNTMDDDLAKKAEAMLEFRRYRDSGLPVPPEVRARHVEATNEGYATGPESLSQRRRTLAQTAWAAIAAKGSEAARRFQSWRPQLGTRKAAWAVAHYQLRVIWKVLHEGVRYRQPETEALNRRALMARAQRALADLRKLGYAVSITRLLSEPSSCET